MPSQIPDHQTADTQMRGAETRVHHGAADWGLAVTPGAEDRTELLPSRHAEGRVLEAAEAS